MTRQAPLSAANLNSCVVSGWIQGAPELRVTRDNRKILNFEIAVEGGPYVPIGHLLVRDEMLNLRAGMKVVANGCLKHHRQRGLFVAATKVRIVCAVETPRRIGDKSQAVGS